MARQETRSECLTFCIPAHHLVKSPVTPMLNPPPRGFFHRKNKKYTVVGKVESDLENRPGTNHFFLDRILSKKNEAKEGKKSKLGRSLRGGGEPGKVFKKGEIRGEEQEDTIERGKDRKRME